MGHIHEELDKVPACLLCNQQVLGFADHGHHAAQRSTYGAVHNQAAQKGAKLFQMIALIFVDAAMVAVVV